MNKSQVLLKFGVFKFGQKGSDKIISIISSDRDNWFMWVSSLKLQTQKETYLNEITRSLINIVMQEIGG